MMLLSDVFIVENLQILNEGSTKSKNIRVRGIFQRANEANNNGRVYPKNILESQVKKLQSKILERTLCGELDHPQSDTIRLSNASHLITKLFMEGNDVIGEAEILNTPAGLTARALIEGGVKIGISSRGMGTLSEGSDGHKVVNEDYNMVTLDLVADPSTRGAHPAMCESTQSKFVTQSVDKMTKESNFVVMLESRLSEVLSSAHGKKAQGRGVTAAKNVLKGAGGAVLGAAGAGIGRATFKATGKNSAGKAIDKYGDTKNQRTARGAAAAARALGGPSFSDRAFQRQQRDRLRSLDKDKDKDSGTKTNS